MRCLAVLVVAVLATACGSHADEAPGSAEVGAALTAQILANGTSRFASIDHVQVQTLKAAAADATYSGSVRYEMVFKEGWSGIAHEMEAAPEPATSAEAQSRQRLIYGLMALKLQFGNFGPGLRVKRDANVKLVRKGNAWDLTLLPAAPAPQLAAVR
jgi:hypothetical protein